MTTVFERFLLCSLFGLSSAAVLAAGLTVSPAVITNDYSGKVTLTLTGLATGQTVLLEKYCDLNTNGVIDPGEPLLQSGIVTDGRLPLIGGVRNLNVPGDDDGATNGQIRAKLGYPGISPVFDYVAADYLWRASNPTNGLVLATQSLTVRQKVTTQGVTGRLTATGTGWPLTNALVVLAPRNGSPVSGAVADADGHYTLYGPPGGFAVLAIRPGFVADMDASGVLIPSNQLVSLNVALPAATRTISGQLRDSATGAGLGGVMVRGEAEPNFFAAVFSDAAGHYTLPVGVAQWTVAADRGQLAQQGYVGWDEGVGADTRSGNVGNLDFETPKANALIYGVLRDAQGQLVSGFSVGAKQDWAYEAAGRAWATNTGFCLGVVAGDWRVRPDDDELSAQGFWSNDTNVTVVAGQARQTDLILQPLTAHLLGRVVDDTGAPVANLGLGVSNDQNVDFYPGTDENGHFDIGVFAGTWHFHIDSDDARQRGLVGPDLPITLTNGETRTNIVFVAQRTTAQITGQVQDDGGHPLAALWVWAWANIGGTSYNTGMETDGNGHYQLGVINGTWSVGLNCGGANGLIDRGYECADNQSAAMAGANQVLNFTVTTAPDTTPPALLSSSPTNNAAGVPVTTTLILTFSEAMQSSVSLAFNQNAPANRTLAWSTDRRTLTVTFGAPLPPGAVVAWTLNPSSLGTGFWDLAGNPLPADVAVQFTTAPLNPPGPDVTVFMVNKSQQDFVQTTATGIPVLQSGTPYGFSAQVGLTAPGTVAGATVRTPDGPTYPLVPDGSTTLRFSSYFATSSALETAFPGGNYTLTMNTAHDGVRTATYNLSGNTYPTTPRVSNFAAAQAVSPASDFLLTWDAFAGGTTNDYIQFQLKNGDGNTIFSTAQPGQPGALNGTNTSFLISRALMPPGQTNQGRLVLAKFTTNDSINYPGALGIATYSKRTRFTLVATGGRDTTPPVLASSSPANGQAGVATNAVVAFTFNEAMLPGYSIRWEGVESYNFTYTWTADQKTLVCAYAVAFPPHATLGWTLNPAEYGGSGFRDVSGNTLSFDACSGSFTTGATGYGPDVNYYVVGKHRAFLQTNTAAPALYPNQPFTFLAMVYPFSPFAAVNATVTPPVGGSHSLAPFGYLDSLSFMEVFASQSALNAAYPSGNYSLTISAAHDGVHAATLPLGVDAYPNAPRISNYTAAQAVNPAADFTLAWDVFAGGTTNDFIQLRLYDAQTDEELFATPPAFYRGALDGLATSAVVPAFTLAANRDYRALVLFARVTAADVTSYPGTPGLVAFDSETRFFLHTVNPPLGLAVTPSVVPGDYAGLVTLHVTGLTNDQAVRVEKFLDANTNGVIETGELLLQSFPLTDGQVAVIDGVRNSSVPGDEDGLVNGMIRASIVFKAQSEANQGVGRYLYRVSPVGGGFTPLTASFTVTQPASAQKITGRVTSGGSPVPYAFTFIMPGPDTSPIAMAVADANGNYTLHCAVGSYIVLALKSGYLFHFNAAPAVNVGSGLTVTQDLAMVAATRGISGRLIEAETAAALAGVQLFCDDTNGWATLVLTDSNGNFTIPVSASAGPWRLDPSRDDAGLHGDVVWNENPRVTTGGTNVTGVVLTWPKATALLYGYLRDDLSQPVPGVRINPQNDQYEVMGTTDPNGYYAVGVLEGQWNCEPRSDDLRPLNLIGRGAHVSVAAGQALPLDLTVQRASTLLQGQARDDTGAPLANSGIEVDDGLGLWMEVPTDPNGHFEVMLHGGQWHLNLDSEDTVIRNLVRATLFVTVVDGVNQTNLVYVAPRATSQILVSVVDTNGVGQTEVGVWGNANLAGTQYNLWNPTGDNGSCVLPVLNGNWTVGVNTDDLRARGFDSVPNQTITVPGTNQTVVFVVRPPIPLQITTTSLPQGTVDRTFSATLAATGGTPPYGWSLLSNSLPAGLWLDGNEVTGTPQTAATNCFTVRVTDSQWQTSDREFCLAIADPLQILTENLPAYLNTPCSQQLLAGGGWPPYSWSFTPGWDLQSVGLSLSTKGVLSGTPTESGSGEVSFRVTDALGSVVDQFVTVTIYDYAPLQITTTNLPGGLVNTYYSAQLQTAGGSGSMTWAVVSNSLPLGLEMLWYSGLIYGTPTTAGTFCFTVSATDYDDGRVAYQTLCLAITGALQVDTTNLPSAVVGVPYANTLQASGGQPPYTWRLAPFSAPLPAGLTLTNSGLIAGTPTTAGTNTFNVQVTDQSTTRATRVLSIIVSPSAPPVITTTSVPGRQVNLPYTNVVLAVSGGTAPYSWSVAVGQLPPGLSLIAASGALTGTPTNTGQFDFTARVTDSLARAATQPLRLTIYPTPPGFPIANEMGMEVLNGVTGDGTNYLVCIQTFPSPQPISAQLISSNGALLGGRINLGRTGGRAVAAFDRTNYLLVWEDSSDDLYGQFINRAGALVGGSFAVSTAAGKQTLDSMKALVFDGTNYLVVWNDARNSSDTDGYGQLIAPSGALVGGEIPVSTQTGHARSVAVAFGATKYLAVWMNQRQAGVETYDVWGRFVSRSGEAGSVFQISQTASPRSYSVRVAYNGTNFLVVWNRDAGGGAPAPAVWEVWGRVLTADGAFVGNEFGIAVGGSSYNSVSVGRAGSNFVASWFETSGATAGSRGRLVNGAGALVGSVLNFGDMSGPRAPYAVPVYEPNRWTVFSWWATWTTNANGQVSFPNGDCSGQFLPLTSPAVRLEPRGWARVAGGQFQFSVGVTGTEGRLVTLQVSRDLLAWTDLLTTADGTVQVTDLPGGPPWQFFRAVFK